MNEVTVMLNFDESDWRLIISSLLIEAESRRKLSEHFYKVKEDDVAFAISLEGERLAQLAERIALMTAV